MSTDLRRHSPRTLSGLTVAVGALLSLLFIAAAARAGPEETKTTTLQQRLESAKVLREFDTEGGIVRAFKTARNCVAFLLDEVDSSVAVVYGLDGAPRFRLSAWNGNPEDSIFRGLSSVYLSDDGSTIAVGEITGYEDVTRRTYDVRSGTELFESDEEAALIPSPGGKYFCKLYDGVNYEALAIYDRRGRTVRSFVKPSEWSCFFLDDTRLVVVDRDTLRIIETNTGNVLNAVALNLARIPALEGYGAKFGSLPLLAVSAVHSTIAVYDGHTLILFSSGGDELWRQVFENCLCAVSFDDSLPRLALQFRDWGATFGYFKVMSIQDPLASFESAKIPALANSDPVSVFHAMWFSDGTIAVWRPLAALPGSLAGSDHYTIFLDADDSESILTALATRPGLYRPVGGAGGMSGFIRADSRGNAVLVSIKKKAQPQGGR